MLGDNDAAAAPPRRRRMSKKERKNLKRKRAATAGGGDAKAAAKEQSSSKADTSNAPSKPAPTLEEYMAGYVPAPPATEPNKEEDAASHSQSLGAWFPSASVVKSSVSYGNDYLAKLAKDRKKRQKMEKNEATAVEEAPEPKASLVLFYQYVSPAWSQAKVSSFLAYLTTIATKHRTNIGGRMRVSTEGVNCTVSAASTSNSANANVDPAFEAAQTLRHFAQDLRQFDPDAFANTDFKFVDGLSADRHFKELKLLPVKELVFYGLTEDDLSGGATSAATGEKGAESERGGKGGGEIQGGVHLDAMEYHQMLKRKDAVVIDVRNHYEAAIGRFDGQMEVKEDRSTKEGDAREEGKDDGGEAATSAPCEGGAGAEYIDPKMRKSTDFTSWLAEPRTKQKLEGKTVVMFCTGGIRCERASAYLNKKMGSEVKGVYQLQGGIERYLQAFPEGGFWRGKNFVFDKREAIGAGNANGDGGVVRKDRKSALPWGTECAKCRKPWDRYIGKRKCYTCGVPVLVCDECMSSQSSSAHKKKKKKRRKEKTNKDGTNDKVEASNDATVEAKEERIRCPLCVEEGVTVPAEDVEYTDNGVRGRLRSSSFSEGAEPSLVTASADEPKQKSKDKAAKSVLKWGGGHASKKKEKRKYSRRPCQFGAHCVRKDCFFYHPEREGKKHSK
ncbi:hypothetical protein ACHAXT_001723 [Thalassiosira profunda]